MFPSYLALVRVSMPSSQVLLSKSKHSWVSCVGRRTRSERYSIRFIHASRATLLSWLQNRNVQNDNFTLRDLDFNSGKRFVRRHISGRELRSVCRESDRVHAIESRGVSHPHVLQPVDSSTGVLQRSGSAMIRAPCLHRKPQTASRLWGCSHAGSPLTGVWHASPPRGIAALFRRLLMQLPPALPSPRAPSVKKRQGSLSRRVSMTTATAGMPGDLSLDLSFYTLPDHLPPATTAPEELPVGVSHEDRVQSHPNSPSRLIALRLWSYFQSPAPANLSGDELKWLMSPYSFSVLLSTRGAQWLSRKLMQGWCWESYPTGQLRLPHCKCVSL